MSRSSSTLRWRSRRRPPPSTPARPQSFQPPPLSGLRANAPPVPPCTSSPASSSPSAGPAHQVPSCHDVDGGDRAASRQGMPGPGTLPSRPRKARAHGKCGRAAPSTLGTGPRAATGRLLDLSESLSGSRSRPHAPRPSAVGLFLSESRTLSESRATSATSRAIARGPAPAIPRPPFRVHSESSVLGRLSPLTLSVACAGPVTPHPIPPARAAAAEPYRSSPPPPSHSSGVSTAPPPLLLLPPPPKPSEGL
jgi:hypothetical protein